MNKVLKPNDIFIATLSKPDATVADLLKNNITADNTSFLTMEEYMETPFVKKSKRYNENGVFKEDVFKLDYILAALKFLELTDEKAIDNLKKSLKYSPTSMQAPIGSEKYDISATYSEIFNPRQQQIGIRDINYIEEPTKTNEELAQSHKIWDTKNNRWMDKTPETISIFDKTFGLTLVYATYDEDVYDPNTGKVHRKGEWKTDENGEYYTETLEDRLLLNKQVVKLNDILTKENSAINKIDFFDSDGFEKSITGTVAKTVAQTAFYLFPATNKVYGAIVAASNLASVLPVFYKNIEALFTGSTDSNLAKNATKMENWFHKFGNSKSYEGRDGFFNIESFGELTSDIFGLLYQLRAAASLSKILMPDPKDVGKLSNELMLDLIGKRNNLSKSLSLGYMALISTSDAFNEAKNAGFDDRSAGMASLLMAGSIYGVMQKNSMNNVATWMLDKSTGYDRSITKGALKKAIKPEIDDVAKSTNKLFKEQTKESTKGFLNSVKKFKNKMSELSLGDNTMVSNMIIEGFEEITEEFTMDAVRGVMDTLSYIGLLKEKGSYGGFKNVFSLNGLEKYIATFLGGAAGGALFTFQQNKMEPFLTGKLIEKQDIDLKDYILSGQTDRLLELIDEEARNNYNNDISSIATDIDGKQIYLGVTETGRSQAQAIADATKQRVLALKARIEQSIGSIDDLIERFDRFIPNSVQGELRELYIDKFMQNHLQNKSIQLELNQKFEEYIKNDYKELIEDIVATKEEIELLSKDENTKSSNNEKLKKLNELLKSLIEEAELFFNGKNNFHYILQYNYLNKAGDVLAKFASIGDDKFSLDKESYVFNKYRTYYKDLPNAIVDKDLSGNIVKIYNPTLLTKERVDKEFEELSKSKFKTFGKDLKLLTDLYITESMLLSKYLKDFQNEDLQKYWMLHLNDNGEGLGNIFDISNLEQDNYNINILSLVLFKDTDMFSMDDSLKYDLAENLFKNNLISVNKEDDDELYDQKIKLIKSFINSIASYWNRGSIWNRERLFKLISYINSELKANNKNFYELNELDSIGVKPESIHINDYLTESNVLTDIIDKINSDKLKNIIDIVKNQQYLTKELFKNIDSYFNSIKNYLYKTIKDLLIDLGLNEDDITNEVIIEVLNKQGNYQYIKDNLNEELIDAYNNYISNRDDLLRIVNNTKNNPIYEALSNIFRKLAYNNRQVDIFEYILTKELEVKNIMNNKTLNFKRGEVNLVLNILEKSIIHLDSLVSGATQSLRFENGEFVIAPSFNDQIRDYISNYTTDNPELVQSIDHTTCIKIQEILLNLQNKLMVINGVFGYNQSSIIDDDNECEYNIKKKQLLFLKDLKNVGDISFIDLNLNVDDDDKDEYSNEDYENIIKQLFESEVKIYNWFLKEIQKDPDFIYNFINNFIKQYPDSINNSYSINSLITKQNSSFMLSYLLSIATVNPIELNSKFVEFLEKHEEVLYKYDLYIAFLIAYASMFNKESKKAFNYYINKIEKVEEKDGKKEELKYTFSNFIYAGGSAGSGKTSVIGKMVNELLETNEQLLAAPTVQKANDLSKSIKGNSENGLTVWDIDKEQSLIRSLFGNDEYNKLIEFKNKFEEWFHNDFLNKVLNKHTDTASGNLDVSKDKEEFSYNGIKMTVYYETLINGIKVIGHKLEGLNDINLNYNNDVVLNINTDESTLLDPFTLSLLDLYAKKSNTNIIMYGDSFLKGYFVKFKDIFINYNINNLIVNRTPYLEVMFRSNNSAVTDNSRVLKEITKEFNRDDKELDASSENEAINQFKLDSNKLKYKIEQDNALGLELTNDKNIFLERLKFLSNIINSSDKNLSILIPNNENSELIENELKGILSSLNIPESKYKIYLENDLDKGIQGSESNYTIIYNLNYLQANTENTNKDIDIDTLSIYTYSTRAKDYTLVFEEDPNNGLYSHYGVNTVYDEESFESELPTDLLKSYTKHKATEIKNNIAEYKHLIEEIVKEDNKKSEEKTGVDEKPEPKSEPVKVEEDQEKEESEYKPINIEPVNDIDIEPNDESEFLEYIKNNKSQPVLDGYHILLGGSNVSYEITTDSNGDKKVTIKGADVNSREDLIAYLKFTNSNINYNENSFLIDYNIFMSYVKFIETLNICKNPEKEIILTDGKKLKLNGLLLKFQEEGVLLVNKIDNFLSYLDKQKEGYVLLGIYFDGDNEYIFTLNSIRFSDYNYAKELYGDLFTLIDYSNLTNEDINKFKEDCKRYKEEIIKIRPASSSIILKDSENYGFVRTTNSRYFYFNKYKHQGHLELNSNKGISLSLFKLLGYQISTNYRIFKYNEFDEFLEWYNKFRFEKIEEDSDAAESLKTFFYNKIWVIGYKPLYNNYTYTININNPSDDIKIIGLPIGLELKDKFLFPQKNGKYMNFKVERDAISAIYYKYMIYPLKDELDKIQAQKNKSDEDINKINLLKELIESLRTWNIFNNEYKNKRQVFTEDTISVIKGLKDIINSDNSLNKDQKVLLNNFINELVLIRKEGSTIFTYKSKTIIDLVKYFNNDDYFKDYFIRTVFDDKPIVLNNYQDDLMLYVLFEQPRFIFNIDLFTKYKAKNNNKESNILESVEVIDIEHPGEVNVSESYLTISVINPKQQDAINEVVNDIISNDASVLIDKSKKRTFEFIKKYINDNKGSYYSKEFMDRLSKLCN